MAKRSRKKGLGKQGISAIKAASPKVVTRVQPVPRSGVHHLLYPLPSRTKRDPVLAEPRQRRLSTELRGVTKASLAKSATGRRKDPVLQDRILYEAICNDYRRDVQRRRAVMFANGKAAKGRRNTAPKKKDWRAEYCR